MDARDILNHIIHSPDVEGFIVDYIDTEGVRRRATLDREADVMVADVPDSEWVDDSPARIEIMGGTDMSIEMINHLSAALAASGHDIDSIPRHVTDNPTRYMLGVLQLATLGSGVFPEQQGPVRESKPTPFEKPERAGATRGRHNYRAAARAAQKRKKRR